MPDIIDTVIIGAGVVGLATARELALAGREVAVLESRARPGEAGSTHNSGVIHAGIYYPAGSLKARLCVQGRDRLYAYCASRHVPHSRCGKLVVAVTAAERAALATLAARAKFAGVPLQELDAAAVQRRAPGLRAVAALWSPATGIVDPAALVLALTADIEAAGGYVLCGNAVTGVRRDAGTFRIDLKGGAPARCRHLINAAGLEAAALAHRIGGLPAASIPAIHFARGHYFSLQAPSPWNCLVYPLPEAGGLGVHSTLDLAGRTRFGPDVEWIDTPDFSVDPGRREAFAAAIRRYWPALPAERLQPESAGVRPKLTRDGFADFQIQGPDAHGVDGLWNLYGIESPGLTAALALAHEVAGRMALL